MEHAPFLYIDDLRGIGNERDCQLLYLGRRVCSFLGCSKQVTHLSHVFKFTFNFSCLFKGKVHDLSFDPFQLKKACSQILWGCSIWEFGDDRHIHSNTTPPWRSLKEVRPGLGWENKNDFGRTCGTPYIDVQGPCWLYYIDIVDDA